MVVVQVALASKPNAKSMGIESSPVPLGMMVAHRWCARGSVAVCLEFSGSEVVEVGLLEGVSHSARQFVTTTSSHKN